MTSGNTTELFASVFLNDTRIPDPAGHSISGSMGTGSPPAALPDGLTYWITGTQSELSAFPYGSVNRTSRVIGIPCVVPSLFSLTPRHMNLEPVSIIRGIFS